MRTSILRFSLAVFILLSLSTGSPQAAPTITNAISGEGPAVARVGEPIIFAGFGFVEPFQVFFSDGNNPTVAASAVMVDPSKGLFGVKVPAGAVTGNMKVTANGVDSAPYFFLVEAGSFMQGTSTVSGQVTANGTPAPGVLLALFNAGGGDCGDVAFQDVGETDPNGNYTMTGVPGDYFVFPLAPAGLGVANAGQQVTLSGTPATLNFALVTATTVSGRIVDDSMAANPVADVRLTLDVRTGGDAHDEVLTDANGRFTTVLSAGDWEGEILPPPAAAVAFKRTMFTVGAGPTQDLGDIALKTGVTLQGTITSAGDNKPLAGASVRTFVSNPCCSESDDEFIQGDGRYSLTVDPNKEYTIEVSTGGRATVVGGFFDTVVVGSGGVTRNLMVPSAAFITGRVTDAATTGPVACQSVEAQQTGGFFGFGGGRAETDPNGDFRLRVTPDPNGYIVRTSQSNNTMVEYAAQVFDGTPGGTYFPCEGTPVAAPTAGATTSGINFALPVAAILEGVISSSDLACGNDLGNANFGITVDDGTTHFCNMGSLDPNATIGYRVTQLPPSTAVPEIRVCVNNFTGFDSQCFNMKTPPAFDPVVIAPGGTATNVNICLAACTQLTWFRDSDGDGFGDPNDTLMDCFQPPGYIASAGDCNDMNSGIHPGQTEICDNADNDCGGLTDEGCDDDNDNFCDQALTLAGASSTCTNGGNDCDDTDAARNPGATELCDSIDNNCNGFTDDGVAGTGGPCSTGQPGVCSNGQDVCSGGAIVCQPITGASAEKCNSLDDSCDGTTDEGCDDDSDDFCDANIQFSGFSPECPSGPGDCNDTVGTINPAQTEVCDNIDNDCVGGVDDGNPGGGLPCATGQPGVCGPGTFTCTGGSVQCVQNVAASPNDVTCDNVDDDCNGTADEDFAPAGTTCGVGACASTGMSSCTAGVFGDTCMAGTPGPTDTTCNGIDENCNGTNDEGFAGSPTSCGIGACASTGSTTCTAGVTGDSCVAGTPALNDATCNNIDDDCNGSADEDFAGSPTTCGVGACASTGSTTCTAGVTGDTCMAGTPAGSDATCNNVDEDCNGTADEDFAATPTTCGVGACASTGSTTCTAGVTGNSCVAGTPAGSDATCNNIDDDCNGSADEDFAGTPTTCGVGVCASTGTTTCTAGATGDSCTAGTPGTEICNTLDDDCDGTADNNIANGCALFVADPLGGETVDCRTTSPPPTFTVATNRYDKFRWEVSTVSNFSTNRVTSGDTLRTTTTFTWPLKKWRKICSFGGSSLFVRVFAVDLDVPKSDSTKKVTSAATQANVQR